MPLTPAGNLQGLLGNYDDNPKNDFQPKSGDDLTETASPQEIHMFGETCKYAIIQKAQDKHEISSKLAKPTFITILITLSLGILSTQAARS